MGNSVAKATGKALAWVVDVATVAINCKGGIRRDIDTEKQVEICWNYDRTSADIKVSYGYLITDTGPFSSVSKLIKGEYDEDLEMHEAEIIHEPVRKALKKYFETDGFEHGNYYVDKEGNLFLEKNDDIMEITENSL
jgi:hypothetical protein